MTECKYYATNDRPMYSTATKLIISDNQKICRTIDDQFYNIA